MQDKCFIMLAAVASSKYTMFSSTARTSSSEMACDELQVPFRDYSTTVQ